MESTGPSVHHTFTPEVMAAQAPGVCCDQHGSTEPGAIQGRHGGGEESLGRNCGVFLVEPWVGSLVQPRMNIT
jgi:hypothetical protein